MFGELDLLNFILKSIDPNYRVLNLTVANRVGESCQKENSQEQP